MARRIVIACALAAAASTGFAQTIIGGATLIDTDTVINGTVNPTTFLTYVSGGDGATGDANGTSFSILSPGLTPSAPQQRVTVLAMVSTASIPLPDPVEYRRDWRGYRIRLGFGDPPSAVEIRELPAPEPLAGN